MKRILILLAVAACLLATAWLAPRLIGDPGYVLIEVAGWRIEASVLVLAGAVLLVWLALWLLGGLIRLPGRALRGAREAARRRQLEQGLLALTEGDWRRAEKALARALRHDGSTAGYLAAARAAQGQSDRDARDAYLQLADRRFGRRHFVTGLARARLLAAEGNTTEAIPVLEALHLRKPRHEGVLRLLLHAYQSEDRWADVRLLAPALKRAGVVEESRARSMVELAAGRELQAAMDGAELEKVWTGLPRRLRTRRDVLRTFGQRARALGRPELADADIARYLDGTWAPELVEIYADAAGEDADDRIGHCRRWQKKHGEQPELLLALGRLYMHKRDTEQARICLERSVELQPDATAYETLGRVLDREGRLESATQCYRNALRLGRGRPVEPLPAPKASGEGAGRSQ